MRLHRFHLEVVRKGFWLCAAGLVLAGCHKTEVPKEPPLLSYENARNQLMETISNQVPGITRIVDYQIDNASPNVTNWSAQATVEFINHYGGIDRTNLPFVFYVREWPDLSETNLHCMVNYYQIGQEQVRAYQEEINRIKNQ